MMNILSDEQSLLVTNLSEHLNVKKLDGNSLVECYFCATSTELKDLRNHVAKHILCFKEKLSKCKET